MLWTARQVRRPQVVVITDPGPDPDDVKVLLVLAALHRQHMLRLVAVVANGGGQPLARARLAKCVLAHARIFDVPVGFGSEGMPTEALPHEYDLQGYADVAPSAIEQGHQLLMRTLRSAASAS